MIFILYFFLIISLLVAWNYNYIKKNSINNILIYFFIVGILLVFAVFRDGSRLPDYQEYVFSFNNPSIGPIEPSYKFIVKNIRYFSKSYLWLFFVYALIGINIKYYAIKKYSPLFFYSISVWISTYFLLHEMIQIRASIASGILLLLIPLIYKKDYLNSIVLIGISFLFHRSSIIYIVLLFLSNKNKWTPWFICYLIIVFNNITNNRLIESTGILNYMTGLYLYSEDIYDLSKSYESLNLFAPYILLQTLTCFYCIYRIKEINHKFKYITICIKISLISIFIYGLPLGVVSLRIAELLSTVNIFLYPCIILGAKTSNYIKINKIIVSIICISILSNFIFLKKFII